MALKTEPVELALVAKAIRDISKEMSYAGLARALLKALLDYSGATRGAVLLSRGGALLAKADASFPRAMEKVIVSHPPVTDFRLPEDLDECVLTRQETICRNQCRSAFQPAARAPGHDISVVCLPLISQDQTIGVVYLESEEEGRASNPACISIISILASQAATSFQSVELFEALRETNMWMTKGQQLGRMGSYRWNTRTLFSRGSRECYRIIGLDPAVNPVPFQDFLDRIHPDDLPGLDQALGKALSTKSAFSHEYRVIHKDGTVLDVIAVGQFDMGPSGDTELEGIIADITERKAAEQSLTDARAELARAARLVSLGELAGSIIHEVNQPLTSITMSTEACLRWLAKEPAQPDEARKAILQVRDQSQRAINIVSGLTALVRNNQPKFADLQINDTIKDVLVLSSRELERASVTQLLDLEASMPLIEGDYVQLQQVVLNLVRNAVEAMADITDRSRVLTVGSRLSEGQALVSIADTGPGIGSESRDRIFNALYTTKTDGLGLGLSICRKIVEAHGGNLWLRMKPTQGAEFTFTLPLRQARKRIAKN
ncbi:MAG: GHKL domain-containing protein [Rhodospirillaceae bacterium]|nr:MAG: GHKL domain-containing protein [Rhodospirillaceae bacterium]